MNQSITTHIEKFTAHRNYQTQPLPYSGFVRVVFSTTSKTYMFSSKPVRSISFGEHLHTMFARTIARQCMKSVDRRMMGTYKTSTGLVGLAVDPNGKETLLELSEDVVESVKRIPADAQYR